MRSAAIVVVFAASAFAQPVDELAQARRLQGALEYEKALALVEVALARGGADPERLASLHALAGELTAGLDRARDAEAHFARALALQPSLVLPPGTSPKLTVPFDAARARDPQLRVRALRTVDPASRAPAVALDVQADPLGLVVGVAVRVVDANGAHREVRGVHQVVLPPSSQVLEVVALDASANRVWIGALPEERPLARPLAPSPPLLARPLPWAVATGALGLGAALCAWKTSSLQSDWNAVRADGMHDYSSLTALESRGKSYALAADIGFGLAATTAVITLIHLIR